MKNKMHRLLLQVTTLIVVFSFVPTALGETVVTEKGTLIDPCCTNSSDEAEIQVFLCYNDGRMTNNSIKISMKNALELSNRYLTLDNTVNSFEESFKQKLAMLKELDLVADDITMEDILGTSVIKWIQSINEIPNSLSVRDDNPLVNAFGILSFGGIGLGVGFGLNSLVPVIGYDNVGIFWFLGKVTTVGFPTIIPQGLPIGIIVGGFIGFVGIYMRVLTPYAYGPFVFGCGFSGPTLWWRFSLRPNIFGKLIPFF